MLIVYFLYLKICLYGIPLSKNKGKYKTGLGTKKFQNIRKTSLLFLYEAYFTPIIPIQAMLLIRQLSCFYDDETQIHIDSQYNFCYSKSKFCDLQRKIHGEPTDLL